jgi:HD-like signal output (HDOD) protein
MELTEADIKSVLGSVKIPPCPTLLQEVMKEAKHPNPDVGRIAKTAQHDAAMTAALLKLTNSPLSGIWVKITSVPQAISFLGLKTTINLMSNIALSQSMGDGSQKFTKFWERSSVCATVAGRIARKITDVSPDDAYAAALFHDCGIPVLMGHYPAYRETVMAQSNQGKDIHAVENEHFATTHAIVGNMLARSWFLPPHICQAILHHHDHTIFTSSGEQIDKTIRRLIGIIYMSELVVDKHICQENLEWPLVETGVLACLGLSARESREMVDDMLELLNDE